MFLVESNGKTPGCPLCGSELKYRDSRIRICRQEGGQSEYLLIRRLRCSECHSYHNELPDVVVPHKHYASEVVCGVIDGIVSEYDTDSEDFPCASTMQRWLRWFLMNRSNMEGFLRNTGYSTPGLGEGILFSDLSLLEAIRNKYQNWLERILRIIYNSGGFLPAFYQ